ncbi:protein kinase [Streptomyces sp. NPDC008343]|uniref:protein kinase domain-containing protein n=1 Tax=Streptomyces sp. NPDC008343 TaxID=3364828 RepID=UPI0036ED6743
MTDQRQPTPSPTPAALDAALTQAGATPLKPAAPARIGPYVPLGLLGSGGMGHVYLARPADNAPGLAAVKVIRPEYAEDPRFRRRFVREAAVHGRVHTPRTPQLLGTGFDDSLLWTATQYLPGLDLAEAVRECGRLGRAGVWRLVGDMGQALSALAAADVVHRDLKPSNVILSLQGAHVIDFGIAQAADSSAITSTGSRVGTPAFMAPEYLREGRCDTASDVFSLAGSLIYAATGHAPFGDGTGVDVMHRVAFEEPRQDIMAELCAVDPALAALLTACLAKDPAGRPTPPQLTDAARAAGHGGAAVWHEPLSARLLARRQACEVLEGTAVQETTRAPLSSQTSRTSQETVQLRLPGDRTAAPAPEDDGKRRKRRAYLAVAAGLAVCAVAAGAVFVTGPSVDETAPAAASATATGSTADDARDSSLPGSSSSPSRDKEKEEREKDSEGTGKDTDATASAVAAQSAGPSASGSAAGETQATPSSGNGGSGAPTAAPTKTATTPATPPWISDCTHYSGTEITDRGGKGPRVVQVQCMLSKRGYSVGGSGVDGEFGADTESAVRLFQSDKGLDVDGEVGPNTWAALRSST